MSWVTPPSSPTPRRAVNEAREKEGTRTLEFLGIQVAADSPAAGGLTVGGVKPASPADRAQIVPGDVIVSFEGVHVKSIGDVVPRALLEEILDPLLEVGHDSPTSIRSRSSPRWVSDLAVPIGHPIASATCASARSS